MTSRTAAEIRSANTRYHDVAACDYDGKWGIDFGLIGQAQVLGKMRKALGGGEPGPFARSLEIGSGTGYFSLNLLQAGVVGSAVCTDISPGMIDALRANADRLGLEVRTAVCEAEEMPFGDESFDLVFGHAVLHHLPHLDRSLRDFHRLLAPGGTLAFAGEPSDYGDRIATLPKRGALAIAPLWRALMGAGPAERRSGNGNGDGAADDHELESEVDVHTFAPATLRALAREAGFERVRVRGEELLANWFGWTNRTLEASARPEEVPWLWRRYAYHGYLVLQEVDRRLLEPRLPPEVFYNLMLAARRPSRPA